MAKIQQTANLVKTSWALMEIRVVPSHCDFQQDNLFSLKQPYVFLRLVKTFKHFWFVVSCLAGHRSRAVNSLHCLGWVSLNQNAILKMLLTVAWGNKGGGGCRTRRIWHIILFWINNSSVELTNLFVKNFGCFGSRTPHWNVHSSNKHWIIRQNPPMTAQKIAYTDLLHRKRLLTLLPVDNAVERVVHMLQDMRLENNTYVIFTSDHGYHLGQYRLLKGKSMPYEMDIKVPFYIRGPGIPRNIK